MGIFYLKKNLFLQNMGFSSKHYCPNKLGYLHKPSYLQKFQKKKKKKVLFKRWFYFKKFQKYVNIFMFENLFSQRDITLQNFIFRNHFKIVLGP